jgi:hypothetical protein
MEKEKEVSVFKTLLYIGLNILFMYEGIHSADDFYLDKTVFSSFSQWLFLNGAVNLASLVVVAIFAVIYHEYGLLKKTYACLVLLSLAFSVVWTIFGIRLMIYEKDHNDYFAWEFIAVLINVIYLV